MRFISLALLLTSAIADAQRLPSEERKPPLTRKENWGMHLGVDFISARFQPTKCESVSRGPNGERIPVVLPCDGQPNDYSARGFGVGLNVGVTFLRYILFGGEAWSIGFGGTRPRSDGTGASLPDMETTNALAGSAYVGLISPPLGANARLGRKVWLGTLLGKSHWSGERKCEGCVYDPLRMGRPWFVEPFAMFGGGDRDGGGGLRLAYRHNGGGFEAMHGAMTLGLFFAFGRL